MKNWEWMIYVMVCPVTNAKKYVGCTIDVSQRLSLHSVDKTHLDKRLWVMMLRERGLKPIMIHVKSFNDLKRAKKFEDDYIVALLISGETLFNKRLNNPIYNRKHFVCLYNIKPNHTLTGKLEWKLKEKH